MFTYKIICIAYLLLFLSFEAEEISFKDRTRRQKGIIILVFVILVIPLIIMEFRR